MTRKNRLIFRRLKLFCIQPIKKKQVMRKIGLVLGLLLAVSLVSCDFILKDKQDKSEQDKAVTTNGGNKIVGEEDGFGCAYSAGYRYSYLKEDCIRVFEEGFRLNPVEEEGSLENDLENNEVSCFILFSQDRKQAELFLPKEEKSILLDSDKTKNSYLKDGWQLNVDKGMVLMFKGEIKFTAAKTIDLQLIHSDQVIEGAEELF